MYYFYSATIQLNALGCSGLTPYSSLFSLGRMQARILQPESHHIAFTFVQGWGLNSQLYYCWRQDISPTEPQEFYQIHQQTSPALFERCSGVFTVHKGVTLLAHTGPD